MSLLAILDDYCLLPTLCDEGLWSFHSPEIFSRKFVLDKIIDNPNIPPFSSHVKGFGKLLCLLKLRFYFSL